MAAATTSSPKTSPQRPKGFVAGHDQARPLISGRDQLEEQVRGLGLERDVADLVDLSGVRTNFRCVSVGDHVAGVSVAWSAGADAVLLEAAAQAEQFAVGGGELFLEFAGCGPPGVAFLAEPGVRMCTMSLSSAAWGAGAGRRLCWARSFSMRCRRSSLP